MFAIFAERSDVRQGAVIPFVVLQKSVARVIHGYLLATPEEYYLPYRSVKARIELFKAGWQNIEDDLLSGRPPVAVSEGNVEEVGHMVMNELQCRSETSQRKCRYYDAPAQTILCWHINMFCVLLKTNVQMPNPEQGQICTETSSDVLDLPRRFDYSIFDPERDTASSLGP